MQFKNGETLESYFIKFSPADFPRHINYVNIYNGIKESIVEYIQNAIDEGSAIEGEKNNYTLTAHNVLHFTKVVKVVTDLINVKSFKLSPYEIFFLLTAIQIHDIGNILGRKNHESSLEEVFYDLFPPHEMDKLDRFEVRTFLDIARSHSGNYNGDKDTINFILQRHTIQYHDTDVGVHLLAALLRFADELAEDSERAKKYLKFKKRIKKESEIYHQYASALRSTIISANQHKVQIVFQMTQEEAQNKYQKENDKFYLIDEIFNRCKKLHYERLYCNKFLPRDICIYDILVQIIIFTNKYEKELLRIEFELVDKGYPMDEGVQIDKICRDSNSVYDLDGKLWTGESIYNYLQTGGVHIGEKL